MLRRRLDAEGLDGRVNFVNGPGAMNGGIERVRTSRPRLRSCALRLLTADKTRDEFRVGHGKALERLNDVRSLADADGPTRERLAERGAVAGNLAGERGNCEQAEVELLLQPPAIHRNRARVAGSNGYGSGCGRIGRHRMVG